MNLAGFIKTERAKREASERRILEQDANTVLRRLRSNPNLEKCIQQQALKSQLVTGDPDKGFIRIPKANGGENACSGIHQHLKEIYQSSKNRALDAALTKMCGPGIRVRLDYSDFAQERAFVDLNVRLDI